MCFRAFVGLLFLMTQLGAIYLAGSGEAQLPLSNNYIPYVIIQFHFLRTALVKPTFAVQVLTGGLTNHTARITFSSPLRDVLPGILATFSESIAKVGAEILNQKSAILKHAPPYIAADPSQAMSVDRQLVEKTALQILDAGPSEKTLSAESVSAFGLDLTGLFEANNKKQGKGLDFGGEQTELRPHIPRLIWHDSYQNVLWIEDLGDMRSLSEILLDDSTSWERDSENNVSRLKEIASDLGTFLARLHATTSNPPTRLVASLTSSSNPDAFHDYLANMVLENLHRPQADVSGAEAHFLADRVRTGLKENAKLAGKDVCLGMVDFWPESVLVDLGITDDDAKDTRSLISARCGLVDWEYFGPTNAANELGIFLAHLHVHMLNSTTSVLTKDRIQLVAEKMFQAYAECPETTWRPSNSVQQRTLLSHGRELVNGVGLYEKKLDDAAKRRILAAGVRILRAAGDLDGVVDLQILRATDQVSNLEAVSRGEDGPGRILQGFIALGFQT